MSLPANAIERLFQRLASTYGAAWTRQWADVPVQDVKTVWAYELSGFAGRLEAVAWALENLPERCPNVIEFRNLCRRAPAPVSPQLPEPASDPERVAAELAKLASARSNASSARPDPKAWARRILSRHQSGEKVRTQTLRMAQQALRIHAGAEA